MPIQRSKLLAPLAIACSLFMAAGAAQAQTISQSNGDNVGGATGFGQTFTATVTGTVTQIQVRPRTTAPNIRFYFFDGPGSGTNGSNASAVTSELVNLVDVGSNASGYQTITLATPLPVVAGNQYAFAVTEVVAFAVDTSASYAGGHAITNFNAAEPALDMAFTVTQIGVAPVPTMSEWAMILLAVALAGGAAVVIQRRRVAA